MVNVHGVKIIQIIKFLFNYSNFGNQSHSKYESFDYLAMSHIKPVKLNDRLDLCF